MEYNPDLYEIYLFTFNGFYPGTMNAGISTGLKANYITYKSLRRALGADIIDACN